MRRFIHFLVFTLLTLNLYSQDYTTVTYFTDDSVKLEMDIFKPVTDKTKNPTFIYVHGGGFSSGQRSDGHLICQYMAQHGFVAASISYSLYMKNKSFSCDGITSEKIKAIRYGVNDLWLATVYLIDHSDEYKTDPAKIIIAGCSAGAETVLHAQFWNYEKMNWTDKKLPQGFKYAGVISGAGAIMDLNLITKQNLVPLMLFHGDHDNLVPYKTAAHHFCDPSSTGWLMLFGSSSIYDHIVTLDGSVKLYTFSGSGHEVANYYFEKEMEQVINFSHMALSDKKFQSKRDNKLSYR